MHLMGLLTGAGHHWKTYQYQQLVTDLAEASAVVAKMKRIHTHMVCLRYRQKAGEETNDGKQRFF